MTESELKRCLIKSLRAQEGEGFRIEDRYRIGVPDCLMKPKGLPGFLIEAKIVRGAKLICTASQATYIDAFHDPPRFLAAIVGWKEADDALYVGWPGEPLSICRYVPQPRTLHSANWPITELLWKWYHDEQERP